VWSLPHGAPPTRWRALTSALATAATARLVQDGHDRVGALEHVGHDLRATMTVHVRAYAPDNWDALVEIHDAARLDELRSSVGIEAFKDLESTYESEELFAGDVWVAELDGQVAGFLALSDDEVTWTYVHPRFYRRGVGTALLRHVTDGSTRRLELTVLDGNDAARRLYERAGFVVAETRTGPLVGNEAFTATGHIMFRDVAST
jgi:ribosomal protein S18 acetylase RimI-like enzyme